jgi:hypothetical protein
MKLKINNYTISYLFVCVISISIVVHCLKTADINSKFRTLVMFLTFTIQKYLIFNRMSLDTFIMKRCIKIHTPYLEIYFIVNKITHKTSAVTTVRLCNDVETRQPFYL